MDIRNYLTCLWPGLSELWWRGRLSALPLAVGFAIGLNSLLALKFFFPDWLNPLLVRSAWWVGIAAWGYWTVRSVRELPALLEPRAVSQQPDRFGEAQTAYLRGQWDAAEPLLLGVLAVEPRDPPALLLLSGVYRHTGRLENASSLIQELRRLEIADRWHLEIEAEETRLARDVQFANENEQAADDPEEKAGDDETDESKTEEGKDEPRQQITDEQSGVNVAESVGNARGPDDDSSAADLTAA